MDGSWHLWWCETGEVRRALEERRLLPQQRIPHFRTHYELTRKHRLGRNLKRYHRALIMAGKIAEARVCGNCMPVTFELPADYRIFVEEYHK